MFIRSLISILLLTVSSSLLAQKGNVKGRITSDHGKPVPYISVGLKNTSYGAQTDENGNYNIGPVKPGQYILIVAALEYKRVEKPITIPPANITENLLLESISRTMEEVDVRGYKPGNVVKTPAISTAPYKQQPTTLVELMNRSAGIRIRQTSGLGSNSNLMLNGFQNRSARYFNIPGWHWGYPL